MGGKRRGVTAISESTIEITFTYKGVRCRERIQLKPNAANLKRAEQHRAAINYAISTNTFDYATTFPHSTKLHLFSEPKQVEVTVGEYLVAWLERQNASLKISTLNSYKKIILNQLVVWFGNLPISELKKINIREKLNGHSAGNKTLTNIQSVLRKALSDAVDDDIIEVNPLAGWSFKKKETPTIEDKIDPFSIEEQKNILHNLEGQGKNLIQFAFWTGMRTSELIALNWSDIDFGHFKIKILDFDINILNKHQILIQNLYNLSLFMIIVGHFTEF